MGTESVHLGYNHPISAPESPDIDFHDVFGGPPRRASIQEMRCSFGETKDSFGLRGEDETRSHRHRWSGLSEKPVFGEEGVNRRRYTSDDFFDDIFGGSDSLTSTPRDPFSSTPGSRVLSPSRPLSPRVSEPFASASLPAQLSLPGKLIKGTEAPTFGWSMRNHHKNMDGISNGLFSHVPLSRFSSQIQEESRNFDSSKSFLSQEISPISDESATLEKPEEINEDKLKKDSTDSQVPSVSHQFHFSFYKWASKGVPLPLSFRGGYNSKTKEKFKFDRSLSASGRIACEGMAKESPIGTSNKIGIGSGTFAATVSSDANSCEIELDNTKDGSTHVNVVQRQPIEEAIPSKYESEIASNHQEIVKEGSPGNSKFQDSKAEKGKISAAIQEAPKSNMKTLRSLFLGNDGAIAKKDSEESKVKSTKKSSTSYDAGVKIGKQDEKRTTLNSVGMEKANCQGKPVSSQDSPAKNRAKGKIKEFVKIYDQETSDQPKPKDTSQSRSFRWKERGKFRTQDDQSLPTPKVNEDLQRTSTPAAPVMVEEFPKKPEKRCSGLKDSSTSTTSSIPNGSEARDGHRADSFHENIQIKELAQNEDELQQAGDSQEEIRAIDAKIRKWSQGKQGNIRSLLSTLQYVLWTGSGWKAVPLVDIIEGNAVKRSYQKALLSLHPDKLQQKGATSHQKYIAEKVFDILQEAWTHFNSLGSV